MTSGMPVNDISIAARIDSLWCLLGDCPTSALRWAGIGWALAHLERDLDTAVQLELDGREATVLARPILRQPSYAELAERRRVAP